MKFLRLKVKRFIKNIILNNASQGLQFGSRWLFNITLINVLDMNAYGVFSFVYSVSNILLAVLPFGSTVYLINEVKDLETSKSKLVDAIGVMTPIFLAILLLYVMLTPFCQNIKGWELSIYGILLGFILSLNMILFSYYKGVGDFTKELKAYSIFFLLLIFFVSYLFFFSGAIKSLHFLFCILIFINSIVFFITFFSNKVFYKSFSKSEILRSKNELTTAFADRKYFGFQEIVTAIYTQSGMLLLFYLLDTETYGYYRAMFVVIAPLFLITVSVSQVVLNYLKGLKGKIMISNFRNIQVYSLLAGLAIMFGMFFIREEILHLIKVPFTDETLVASSIVLAAALIRFVFSNYEMLLIVLGKQKYRFYMVIVAAVVNITLVFGLLPKYGLIGAVLTNFLAYFVLLIGLVYITERNL